MDEDFGPLFIKFCSYFPYNAKLCLNGHEYLKRQLAKRGIAFEAPARSVSRLNRAIKSFDHEIQRLWEGYDLAA